MKKLAVFLISVCVSFSILAACKGGDDKAKEENADKPKTAKVENTEEKIIKLGSLGFTVDEFKENWNSAQAEMEESGSYQLKELNITNGEFKEDVADGLILEGIVNEGTNEVARVSLVKKYVKVNSLEQSLDQSEDTIAAFFLLVAATNKEEKISEQEVAKLTNALGIMNDTDDIIDTDSELNNVKYTAVENERGLVLTATEKTD